VVDQRVALLIELYEDVLRENVIAARRIAGAESSARDALAELIADRVACTCRNQELPRVFLEEEAELPARQQSRLIAARHEYEQILLELVSRGEAAGEFNFATTPQIFVNAVLGPANWTYKWYQPQGPLSPEELGSQMANILLATLRSP
jgi:hypothetical protein